jgi:hypothetical protein
MSKRGLVIIVGGDSGLLLMGDALSLVRYNQMMWVDVV